MKTTLRLWLPTACGAVLVVGGFMALGVAMADWFDETKTVTETRYVYVQPRVVYVDRLVPAVTPAPTPEPPTTPQQPFTPVPASTPAPAPQSEPSTPQSAALTLPCDPPGNGVGKAVGWCRRR